MALETGRMEWTFAHLEKTAGEADFGAKIRISVLDMVNLRCLVGIQVETLKRWLSVGLWHQGEKVNQGIYI